MHWLITLFGIEHHLTAAQECARALLVFVFGLVLVRLTGRRVFGKWSALDVIVSIVIGSNLSRVITGNAPMPGTLLACAALMGLHFVLSVGTARWRWLSRLLEGVPVDLGIEGDVSHRTRIWHAVSKADLDEALRGKGIETAAEARKIVLEPSGTITVLKAQDQ